MNKRIAAWAAFCAVAMLLPAHLAYAAPPAAKTVAVHIHGGKGHTHKIDDVPWKKGQTVLHTLQFLAARKQQPVPHVVVGKGETAFVKEIDGLSNQGSGGRNWMYRVNGKGRPVSCGACILQPGDQIEWSFERYN